MKPPEWWHPAHTHDAADAWLRDLSCDTDGDLEDGRLADLRDLVAGWADLRTHMKRPVKLLLLLCLACAVI